MTKISKKSAYPIKAPVVRDYFVGTDSENNNKTVSFGFEDAANLINKLNGILVVNYKFVIDENILLAASTEGNFLSEANETEIDSITKIYLNKSNLQEDDLSELFVFIKDHPNKFSIKLQNSENPNASVYFNIIGVVNHTDYFVFDIEVSLSNPSMPLLEHFNVYFFNFELKQTVNKTSELENDGEIGASKYVEETVTDSLQNQISNLKLPNEFLRVGTNIAQSGSTINIGAENFDVRINQEVYTNQDSFETFIGEANLDLYRIDVIVIGIDGIISKLVGIEAEEAIKPVIDTTQFLEITSVTIFGNTIGEITPIPTIGYVEKTEFESYLLTGTGIITDFILPDKKSTIVFDDAITELHSFFYANVAYPGKKLIIYNNQDINVKIKHNTGTQRHFMFFDENDFVILPKQAVEFFLDYSVPYGVHRYIGIVSEQTITTIQNQFTTIENSINVIENNIVAIENPDQVLKYGQITFDTLNVLIAENEFAWQINQIETLFTPQVTTGQLVITPCTAGFFKNVLLQGKEDGTYTLNQGAESNTEAVIPNPELNTIGLQIIRVDGSTITGIEPADLSGYIQKSSLSNYYLTGTGVVDFLVLPPNKSTIIFNEAITEFHGFFCADSDYQGRRTILKNNQNINVLIKHDSLDIIPFAFPNEEDFILKPNESIEFFNEAAQNTYYASRNFIGVVTDISGKADTTYVDTQDALVASNASSDATAKANTAETTAKSYADGLVIGLLDDRGNFDASNNVFPSTGGSGTAGAILKGDLWTISVAGTLGGVPVTIGDAIRALTNTPGQTASNWVITENNIGYVPENNANKTATLTGNEASTSLFLNVLGFVNALKNSLFSLFPSKTTLVDADGISIFDSVDSSKTKFISWANFKSLFKTVNSTSILGSGNITIPSKSYSVYYINTATGVNATGVYEDASKPFATIDYVLANFTINDGDTFYLQGTGLTYAMNTKFPNKNIIIYADDTSTNILDFSGNNNTYVTDNTGVNETKVVFIKMIRGVIRNERSGGTGVQFSNYIGYNVILNADVAEIYWNTSTWAITNGGIPSTIKVNKKISCRTIFLQIMISSQEVYIPEFVCLANGASFTQSKLNDGSIGAVRIGKISGSGSYTFWGPQVNIVGDISTTGVCQIHNSSENYNGKLHFENSIITGGGFLIPAAAGADVVISGRIKSISSLTNHTTGIGIIRFINFSADLGTSKITVDGTKIISFENCSIESTNSPLGVGTTVGTGTFKIANSSFKTVNAVPLMTGGAGGTRTLEVLGIDTNATVLSDQEGSGVTVTVINEKQKKIKPYTVSTLPTGVVGDTAYVTDALAPTYMTTIVGGGSVVTPVFHNGTDWVAN